MICELPDMATVDEKMVIARKDYKCCECGRDISKGQKHKRFKACWPCLDGWETYRWCLKCDRIRDLVFAKYPEMGTDEGAPFGCLFEWIREQVQCNRWYRGA